MLDLGIAAYEAREAAERRGLQARPRQPRPRQLEDLQSGPEALHGVGPSDRTSTYPSTSRTVARSAGRSQVARAAPSGRRGESSTHRRVVHPQIAADRADDDLPELRPTRIWISTPCERRVSSA